MQRLFYSDIKTKEQISYEQLLKDICSAEYFVPYLKCESYYEIFKQIIISLLIGRELVLLDLDFKDEEIEKLIGSSEVLMERVPFSASKELTMDNLIEKMSGHLADWRITLFTSGTTGLPKKVSHTYESITRQVHIGKKHVDDVWGYAYNPTHMAGLQVFFQCLLNLNTIVRLFGLKKEEIYTEIQDYSITHISATPTFYRLLLPASEVCGSIIRMTSGGEKFDKQTLDALHSVFPNAQLTNVYASTEAGTLFASKGNNFMIKGDMVSKVKVVDNELYLHKSLMGESASLKMVDGWYATGDLIEIIATDPLEFKFISRKNEMINVGGYKVNPSEVEEIIRSCKGVQDVTVFGKTNRLIGNVVCCEIVREDLSLTELSIRRFLADKLQEFKIPRVIKFVETLQTTRTGKILRKL